MFNDNGKKTEPLFSERDNNQNITSGELGLDLPDIAWDTLSFGDSMLDDIPSISADNTTQTEKEKTSRDTDASYYENKEGYIPNPVRTIVPEVSPDIIKNVHPISVKEDKRK